MLVTAIIKHIFFSVQYQESLDACKQRLCNGNEVAANFEPKGGKCNLKDGCQNGLGIERSNQPLTMLYEIPEY